MRLDEERERASAGIQCFPAGLGDWERASSLMGEVRGVRSAVPSGDESAGVGDIDKGVLLQS